MEINPTILSDVLYDIETQTFFSKTTPAEPLEDRAFSTDIPEVSSSDILYVAEPTYIMETYHSCWGHAYEFTLGLLSILHEYDSQRLRERSYRLFILRKLWLDHYRPEEIARLIQWDFKHVDHLVGKYRGAYAVLHECLSSVPILFERYEKHRYIHFHTIIYGGNMGLQRNIHNCHERYSNRSIIPVASDIQIQQWMDYAKEHLRQYLQIKDKAVRQEKTILFIDRKGSRAFTEKTKAALIPLLGNPVYMEDYTLAEQIEAFINADIVIAVHGSTLLHLLWSSPGTKLIELHGGTSPVEKIFKSYTQYLGQNIYELFTTQLPWDKTFNDPIEITLENLEDIKKLTLQPLADS